MPNPFGWTSPIPWLPRSHGSSRKTNPKAQAGIAMLMAVVVSLSYFLVLASGNSNMFCSAFYFVLIGVILMLVNMVHLRHYTNLIILIIFSGTVLTLLAIYFFDLMPIIGTVLLLFSIFLAVVAAFILYITRDIKKEKKYHHRHDGLKEPEEIKQNEEKKQDDEELI